MRVARPKEQLEIDEMPKTIGRYEIIYLIAAGGMASVYAGRLLGMAGFERLFAIKVIHSHLAKEHAFIDMFLDEARLAARIHHPNVAEIFEVGEENGRFYMVGDLVLGQDLRALIEKKETLGRYIPLPLLADVVANVCAGLEEAHNLNDADGEPLNLIHRDISTRNILVSYKGHVKLIDFGVAFARGRLAQTRDGSTKGKIGYMPPEQLRGEPIDRRADIFALGIVLYTLVVGEHPFPYDNEGAQVAKILDGEFRAPKDLNPSIDEALQQIILKAMASSPDKRYSTASAFEEALREYVRKNDNASVVWSDIMKELFSDEIASHHAKIRAHRPEKCPLAEPKQARRVTVVHKRSQTRPHDRHSSVVRQVIKQKRTIRVMGVGVLFLALIIVALMIGSIPFTPPKGDGTRSSEEGSTTTKSPKSPFSKGTYSSSPFEKGGRGDFQDTSSPTPIISGENNISPGHSVSKEISVIDIEGLVENAQVFCDSRRVSLPLTVPHSNTPLQLRVVAPGYVGVEKKVIPNQDQTLHIEMKRLPSKRQVGAPSMKGKGRVKKQKKPKKRDNGMPSRSKLDAWEVNPFD